jgi:VWFA-related protein
LWAAAALAAQAPQAPTFRGGVDLVHLDVSVLDRDRRPVRGLTVADFTVLEDGRPQPIVAFSAVELPRPSPPPVEWMRAVGPDVTTNEIARTPEGRLIVLLLDDALIPFDPRFIRNAKDVGRRVVDQISPADRVAVVFSAASGGTQNFTNDRARLLAAIETLNPSYAHYTMGWEAVPPARFAAGRGSLPLVPQMDPDTLFKAGSMRTLRDVADTLIAAPERRKLLIFVSPGITIDVDSASAPVQAMGRGGSGAAVMALKDANAALFKEMPELFRRMQLANVTIYPVDPCGLGGLEEYVLRQTSGLPALRGVTSPPPPGYDWLAPTEPPAPAYLARHTATIGMDFILATASNTGGRAIVNTNEFATGIDRIFDENSRYYLIGYAAPARNRPGSLHRIDVRVNRRDVDVRTRSGYAMPEAEPVTDPRRSASAALLKTLAGPVAAGDLPLAVALAPVAGPDGPLVTLVLGLEQPAVTARISETIELEARAFTPDGQPRGLQRHMATVTMAPTADGRPARYELLSQLALAPGRYEVRIGARRLGDGAAGSVYADVEVPDFAAAPIALSGALVDVAPPVAAAPRSAFASIVPVVPTTRRDFSLGDRVSVFFRIYQGGSRPLDPVSLAIRMVDQSDAVVLDSTDPLSVERFGAVTRASDYRFMVPVASLAPGAYLLTVEAERGSARASRAVRFTVQNRAGR